MANNRKNRKFDNLLALIYELSETPHKHTLSKINKRYVTLLNQNVAYRFLEYIQQNMDVQRALGALRYTEKLPKHISNIIKDELNNSLLDLIYRLGENYTQDDLNQFKQWYAKLVQENLEQQFSDYIKKNMNVRWASGVLRYAGTIVIQGKTVELFPLTVSDIIMEKLNIIEETNNSLLDLIYKLSETPQPDYLLQFNQEYAKLEQENLTQQFLDYLKENMDAKRASGILRYGYTVVSLGRPLEKFPFAVCDIVKNKFNTINKRNEIIVVGKPNVMRNHQHKAMQNHGFFRSDDLSLKLYFDALIKLIYKISEKQEPNLIDSFNKKFQQLVDNKQEAKFLNYLMQHLDGAKASGVLRVAGTVMIQSNPVETFPITVSDIIMSKVNASYINSAAI
ncbi:hypothetical protein EP47_11970 [Legionella norrlandica]|uniref:Uncharacterized protein n=1 Tax=Legionella norrlandica TaxID=1498499 RepID=A0A0A2SUU3_9GAMM|nr:hypothetical protein [Legionella norrlandica]KGP63501.1 hypothetical protein EP47_11970 [Legionella norrlandica]